MCRGKFVYSVIWYQTWGHPNKCFFSGCEFHICSQFQQEKDLCDLSVKFKYKSDISYRCFIFQFQFQGAETLQVEIQGLWRDTSILHNRSCPRLAGNKRGQSYQNAVFLSITRNFYVSWTLGPTFVKSTNYVRIGQHFNPTLAFGKINGWGHAHYLWSPWR